ncbi:hypothetical protein GCM10009087_18010 [Sphingomonas oligophenolica]
MPPTPLRSSARTYGGTAAASRNGLSQECAPIRRRWVGRRDKAAIVAAATPGAPPGVQESGPAGYNKAPGPAVSLRRQRTTTARAIRAGGMPARAIWPSPKAENPIRGSVARSFDRAIGRGRAATSRTRRCPSHDDRVPSGSDIPEGAM